MTQALAPVTRVMFFEQDGETGKLSVFEILELLGTAEEAVNHCRSSRWAPIYRRKLCTLEQGYAMPDGSTFFPFKRAARPLPLPR